jgi:tetratricopeptide (TPR) repeat protein
VPVVEAAAELAGDDLSRAHALNSLAQGRLNEALRHYERSLKISEKALGPKHPDLVPSLIGLGETQIDRGKASEGLAHLERALKLATEETAHFP